MATAQFIHDGKSIDYTPGADVSAGDVVVQNDLIGIAKLDIASGALGALAVTGVFDLPKATGVGSDRRGCEGLLGRDEPAGDDHRHRQQGTGQDGRGRRR